MISWLSGLRRLSVKQLLKNILGSNPSDIKKYLRFDFYFFMRILKKHPLLSIVNGMVIDLPAPSNLSYM